MTKSKTGSRRSHHKRSFLRITAEGESVRPKHMATLSEGVYKGRSVTDKGKKRMAKIATKKEQEMKTVEGEKTKERVLEKNETPNMIDDASNNLGAEQSTKIVKKQ